MNRKPKILVVGSFVMDVIATTHVVPGRGEAVYGTAFQTACGGKGVNQAVQCARLGAEVTIIGCVGNDGFGTELKREVAAQGVDISHVRTVEGVTTGVGHITLEVKNGVAQNRIVVIPGANLAVEHDDVAWLETGIAQFDAVLLQLEIPAEVNLSVARWAHKAGVAVLLNPAPATPLDDALLPYVTYLIPNEQEAAQESGRPLRVDDTGVNRSDLKAIVKVFQARGAANVIVTLGEYGALLATQDGVYQGVESVRMDAVADPTGAGDSFVAAFCIALSMGMSQALALSFAVHTAAITVTSMGAMPSLPMLDQVVHLMEERKADPLLVEAITA
ncbi:ribokinase [Bengtsoniella intestinalis]|uniref:ribokinase n=1 Tax=Bengtsoniella intestinalis TaxID=3073143 RepID=UPI00391F67B6